MGLDERSGEEARPTRCDVAPRLGVRLEAVWRSTMGDDCDQTAGVGRGKGGGNGESGS